MPFHTCIFTLVGRCIASTQTRYAGEIIQQIKYVPTKCHLSCNAAIKALWYKARRVFAIYLQLNNIFMGNKTRRRPMKRARNWPKSSEKQLLHSADMHTAMRPYVRAYLSASESELWSLCLVSSLSPFCFIDRDGNASWTSTEEPFRGRVFPSAQMYWLRSEWKQTAPWCCSSWVEPNKRAKLKWLALHSKHTLTHKQRVSRNGGIKYWRIRY